MMTMGVPCRYIARYNGLYFPTSHDLSPLILFHNSSDTGLLPGDETSNTFTFQAEYIYRKIG